MRVNVRVDLQPVDQSVFMPEFYGEGAGTFEDGKAKRAFSTLRKAENISRNLNLEALFATLHVFTFAASELRLQHGCEIPGMLNNLLKDGLLRIGQSFHAISLGSALALVPMQQCLLNGQSPIMPSTPPVALRVPYRFPQTVASPLEGIGRLGLSI